MNEEIICQDFAKFLIDLAIEEGNKFREQYKREPTEAEAQEIVKMIERQLKTALIMQKK
jgi:hypothetical protein